MDDPIAALRRQFIESVTGMDYCNAGAHVAQFVYRYPPDDSAAPTYCYEHPAPVGPADPAKPGICKVGRMHSSTVVYWVPVMGITVCPRHLATLVREIIRRGEFGR